MPTRNLNLTEHHDRFFESRVASGEFRNASEVVRAGLRLLERQRREEHTKLEALREAARRGFEQLDRGEAIAVPVHELGDFIRRLGEGPARQREQQDR
jgi:antitoxin ParD1/3/4